tara:strand:- start:3344 stop:3688 length:345 start_codon:yes stop_codon:yes gene_type:complete
MSCFNPNFEIQSKHVSLLSPTTQRIITNFLRRSSKGNIIGIDSIKYRKIELVSTVDFVLKFSTELILECRCRDSYGFPGMIKLPENMYSALKPILKDFSSVKLEYHYSMYCSRD